MRGDSTLGGRHGKEEKLRSLLTCVSLQAANWLSMLRLGAVSGQKKKDMNKTKKQHASANVTNQK